MLSGCTDLLGLYELYAQTEHLHKAKPDFKVHNHRIHFTTHCNDVATGVVQGTQSSIPETKT